MNSAEQSKIIIKENKQGISLETPRFSLSYGQAADADIGNRRLISFNILSALKGGDHDVILEVDSSLLNAPRQHRADIALDFVRAVRSAGIDFRYDKNAEKTSFFSQLFRIGDTGSSFRHRVLTYVPKGIWNSETFVNILPTQGIRYYIVPPNAQSSKLLDDMRQGYILDDEKLDIFDLIVFDCCIFGQMGIYTKHLSLDDIKGRLKNIL
ncbi:hypothetical protein [Mahella australiensis]|uniref:Uncharacterized protein n=1 Tax=Mahella australiensis (strain DSM 15567 / CIP 107919 / 50-1 BON) TaxID=697281 RepID=F3ZZ96_MAHA5|nr:hypothetical protein [Mahella australiensis]AEE97878.1 hypothetical protein Mahau_2742 [Mahella australiensis 50-1 BON]